jgi:hypothetical protein
MLRDGSANWLKSANGTGGSISEVRPCARRTALLGGTGVSKSKEGRGEICEGVVDEDEDGDPGGCGI